MSTTSKICMRRINRDDPISVTIQDLESDINFYLDHGWELHGFMNTISTGASNIDGYITQMLVKNTLE